MDAQNIEALKAAIREIPDWPKKGILFYDVTTLLKQGRCFEQTIDALAEIVDIQPRDRKRFRKLLDEGVAGDNIGLVFENTATGRRIFYAPGLAEISPLVWEAMSSADVVMVDRRARPGGHWNNAYPFVRLHQVERALRVQLDGQSTVGRRDDPQRGASREQLSQHARMAGSEVLQSTSGRSPGRPAS